MTTSLTNVALKRFMIRSSAWWLNGGPRPRMQSHDKREYRTPFLVRPEQSCDIVGWYVSSGGDTMEWMAEVETEASLSDPQIADKWMRTMKRGILLPLGAARLERFRQKLTQDASLVISCIYEYTVINGVCHIL